MRKGGKEKQTLREEAKVEESWVRHLEALELAVLGRLGEASRDENDADKKQGQSHCQRGVGGERENEK